MNNLTVYKDNNVINASYRLTLSEQRLVLACISQIRSDLSVAEQSNFSLSITDYAVLFNVTEDCAYRELREVADRLFDRYVIVDAASLPDTAKREFKVKAGQIKTRWVSHVAYDNDDKKITIGFAPMMIPYLSQLKKEFTKYRLEYVARFTSIYAVRIYELLAQKQFTEKKMLELSLDDLKQKLQVEDRHKIYGNLNSRVLKPAIVQINQYSNMLVECEPVKKGRAVVSVRFAFKFKNGQEPTRSDSKNPNNKASEKEIKAKARVGETYDQARGRIIKDKQTVKTVAINDDVPAQSKTKTVKDKEDKTAFEAFKMGIHLRRGG